MPRNGSGVCTPDVDFTVEAASPPIEIAALDQALEDIADELTNSIAADGQTNPSADLKMNGFKHTNVGAATALTHYARVSELIDQDHLYYVDSGTADTYAITPNPAIAAYEEGQRFSFRAIHTNTGASTLNVNGLGEIAIQTVNAAALSAGAILIGGIYEVTYDANTSPDRWVLTSMPSKVPDAMLSSNVPLLNGVNVFTASGGGVNAAIRLSAGQPAIEWVETDAAANNIKWQLDASGGTLRGLVLSDDEGTAVNWLTVERSGAAVTTVTLGGSGFATAGALTTPNVSAAEVGFKGAPSRNVTSSTNTADTDAGGTVRFTSGSGQTFTLDGDPPTDSIVILDNDSGNAWTIAASGTLTWAATAGTGSRTLGIGGMAVALHKGSGNWKISGGGLS